MQAQRLDGLLGKVARINPDGSIPKDNPFVGRDGARPGDTSPLGTATSRAATIHPTTGELWEVEHGTRGGDEVNVVRKGKDYGWPTIAYAGSSIAYGGPITGNIAARDGMEQPLYYWDPVIGPSGMAFYTADLFPAWKNSLFIGGHQTNDSGHYGLLPRWRESGQRGATAHRPRSAPAHPRRAAGSRWRALPPHRRSARRQAAEARAEGRVDQRQLTFRSSKSKKSESQKSEVRSLRSEVRSVEFCLPDFQAPEFRNVTPVRLPRD